jgi:hypothetical protein
MDARRQKIGLESAPEDWGDGVGWQHSIPGRLVTPDTAVLIAAAPYRRHFRPDHRECGLGRSNDQDFAQYKGKSRQDCRRAMRAVRR